MIKRTKIKLKKQSPQNVRIGPLYSRWAWMIGAVYNPNHTDYPWAGGSGLTCHWVKGEYRDFENWVLNTLGPPPGPDYVLHRPNQIQGWEPGNLVWADHETVATHQLANHLYTYKGKTKPLDAWAREFDVNRHTLRTRILNLGWKFEDAIKNIDGRKTKGNKGIV